mgnify:CR=1 FL=1
MMQPATERSRGSSGRQHELQREKGGSVLLSERDRSRRSDTGIRKRGDRAVGIVGSGDCRCAERRCDRDGRTVTGTSALAATVVVITRGAILVFMTVIRRVMRRPLDIGRAAEVGTIIAWQHLFGRKAEEQQQREYGGQDVLHDDQSVTGGVTVCKYKQALPIERSGAPASASDKQVESEEPGNNERHPEEECGDQKVEQQNEREGEVAIE